MSEKRVRWGTWKEPEFEALFEAYHYGRIGLEEIAKKANTNATAALHAYYRWRRRKYPGEKRKRMSDPRERLIQLALEVLGEEVQKRIQALEEENQLLRRTVGALEAQLRAAERVNSSLERQIAEVLQRRGLVGSPPPD